MGVIDDLKQHILIDGFHVVVDFEKSKDSWVVDKETSKRYLDCYSQFCSQAIGWNHPELNKKWIDDNVISHKIANSDMYSEVYRDFVSIFSKITPDFDHYYFVDGGTLAVENALKAAFDFKHQLSGTSPDSMDVIHLKEAFHGRGGYTLSITNNGDPNNNKTKWFPKFKWTRVTNPKIQFPIDDVKVSNLERMSLQETERALEKGNVAAIIIEPIQGEGGDNHFRKKYFQKLRKLANQYKALLIFDEVQTGMGLTGKMWAYEHFDVVPDILCFGKKSQVCGFCATKIIDSVKNNVFSVSGRINSTWGGNIVDMARATKIIEIILNESLVENASYVGEYFLNRLKNVKKIKNPRGRGLMLAFDLETTERRDEVFKKMSHFMLSLKSGNKSIRFRPHLTFSKQDVDFAILLIENSLK